MKFFSQNSCHDTSISYLKRPKFFTNPAEFPYKLIEDSQYQIAYIFQFFQIIWILRIFLKIFSKHVYYYFKLTTVFSVSSWVFVFELIEDFWYLIQFTFQFVKILNFKFISFQSFVNFSIFFQGYYNFPRIKVNFGETFLASNSVEFFIFSNFWDFDIHVNLWSFSKVIKIFQEACRIFECESIAKAFYIKFISIFYFIKLFEIWDFLPIFLSKLFDFIPNMTTISYKSYSVFACLKFHIFNFLFSPRLRITIFHESYWNL